MTNAEFKAWQSRLHLTRVQAGEALGVSERAIYNYSADREIPRYIELACCELERRWNERPAN
jgi:DNA-binding XRE family transcriptional regulator